MKKIIEKSLIITVLTFISFGLNAQNSANDIVGKWLTEDDESVVEIYKGANNKYFGKMIWLKEPIDMDKKSPNYGKPFVDKKTNQPLTGTVILRELKFNGKDTWKGDVYDPRKGKCFSCKIKLTNNKKTIKAKAFFGISLLGTTVVWQRTNKIPKR